MQIIIVFHTTALIGKVYYGMYLFSNNGFQRISQDICTRQMLQQYREIQIDR